MKSRVLAVCGLVAGLFLWVSSPADETSDIESLTKQAHDGAIFERFSAIRALGRSGDPQAFDPLVDFLEAAVREDIQVEAARALGALKDTRAIAVLIDALAVAEIRTDGTESKGWAAARALHAYEKATVLPLCAALSSPNPTIRKQAGTILGWLEDPRSIGPLINAMADSTSHSDRYARYAYERFMRFGQPAMDGLVDALEDNRPWLCIGAARSLAIAAYHDAADALASRLSDPNARVRYEVALALATLNDRRGLDVLVAALSDRAATMNYREAQSLSRALAKLGGRRVVKALIAAVAIENERVISHFAWALGEIGDTLAVVPLIEVSAQRGFYRFVDNAVRALAKIGDPRAVEPLIASLETGSSEAIVWALGELRDPRAVDALIRVATRPGARASHGGPDAAAALTKIGEPAVVTILAALENDSLPAWELEIALASIVGMEAVGTLLQRPGRIATSSWLYTMGRDAVPLLIEGLSDPDPAPRARCVSALRGFKDPRSVEPLCLALNDQDAAVRRDAANALFFIGDARAVEPLIEALTDEDVEVQRAVRSALEQLQDPRAVVALDRLAWDDDADPRRRYAAWQSSQALQMRRVPYDRHRGWQSYRRPDIRARWRAPTGEIYVVGDFGVVGLCDDTSCDQMESGTTERLHSVWGTSASDVFAVGERGTIIHYDGSAWSTTTSGTRHDLYRVIGTAPGNVFAIGWAGTILHFDGSRWQPLDSHTELTLRDIWAFSSDDIYVVGDGGVALHYDGIAWGRTETPTSSDLLTIWGDPAHNIYAGGRNGTVLHNWKLIEENTLGFVHRIWGLETGETLVEAGRDVYQLVDGVMVSLRNLRRKRAWIDSITTPVISDMDRRSLTMYGPELLRGAWSGGVSEVAWIDVSAFWTPSHGHLYGIDDDRIRYSDGVDWYSVKLDTVSRLIDIAGVSQSSFYLLGSWKDDVIHFSRSKIRNVSPGTKDELKAIWAGSEQDVFVVGKSGLIMRYDGDQWDRMKSPAKHDLAGVWGTTPENVYAVGGQGTIARYDGRRWRLQRSNTRLNLSAVWGFDAKHIFAVGQAGKILRYDGRRWRSMDSGVTSNLTDVWGTAPDHVFACGYGGVIVHFDGTCWTQMYTGTTEPFRAIGGSSATKIFAASRRGLHYYYDIDLDGGLRSRGAE